jgi:hypothetical protein
VARTAVASVIRVAVDNPAVMGFDQIGHGPSPMSADVKSLSQKVQIGTRLLPQHGVMSEVSAQDGSWPALDRRWYAPEQHPMRAKELPRPPHLGELLGLRHRSPNVLLDGPQRDHITCLGERN